LNSLLPVYVEPFLDEDLSVAYERQASVGAVVNPMDIQTEVNGEMRHMLIDWLADICSEFGLNSWTFHLAVQILDRFMARRPVRRGELQLIGSTALFLSVKFSATNPDTGPGATDFVTLSDNAFTGAQVRHAEFRILRTLRFHVWFPTVPSFISFFLERFQNAVRQEYLHPMPDLEIFSSLAEARTRFPRPAEDSPLLLLFSFWQSRVCRIRSSRLIFRRRALRRPA
jgi:hypothetical protein